MNDLTKDKYGLIKTGEGRYVNPQFASQEGLEGVADYIKKTDPQSVANFQKANPSLILGAQDVLPYYGASKPTTITSSSLSGTETPSTLPQINTDTTRDAGASINGIAESTNTGLQGILTTQEATRQKQAEQVATERGAIQKSIDFLRGKGQAQVTAEAQADIPELTKLNSELVNEYNTKALEYKRMEENIGKSGIPLNTAQYNAQLRSISRDKNSELADIAIRQSVVNNNLTTAQSLVNRKIDLIYGDLKDVIQYQTQFYNNIKGDLTKSEDRIWTATIENNTRAYTEGKEKLKTLETFKIQALTNIFSDTNLSAIQKSQLSQSLQTADTIEEAITAAGNYSTDIVERQTKQQLLTNARLQGQKLSQEIESGKPLTGEFSGIINGASGLVPNTMKSTVKQNIANAIASENYTTAYAEVANAVSNGLTGTNKTTFDDARTDIGVMSGMRKAIKDYTDAGGDIGFLKGTADQIAKKVGQLVVDPKFSALGTQLQREFQAYRNAMTGAAFTPEESREYAAVNPRTNATLDLNLATIDGALNQLSNRVTSTVNARIPDAQKIYDLAFTKSDMNEQQTPVGDVQYVGGVKYLKAQDGLYYPETQTSNTQTTTPTVKPDYSSINNTNSFSGLGSFFNFK